MAATKYTYSIQDDFPNHKVASNRLTEEIGTSVIVTALDHIDTDDVNCDIWFKEALSAGDETILDGIVAAHSGEPLEAPPSLVRIQDVEDLDPNKARSKVKGINFDAPAGQWTKKGTSFPYRTNVLCGKGYGGFCEDGDKVEFSIEPQQVGAVTAPAAQGVKIINAYLPDEAWAEVLQGMWLQFDRNPGAEPTPDSLHPGDDEYEIESFDKSAGTITIRTGLETALSGGDAVFLLAKYGEEIELQNKELVDVGADTAGSAPLPANMIFNTWFFNGGVAQKRVRFRLSFKYGPPATS
jgi:hypothetical protein